MDPAEMIMKVSMPGPPHSGQGPPDRSFEMIALRN